MRKDTPATKSSRALQGRRCRRSRLRHPVVLLRQQIDDASTLRQSLCPVIPIRQAAVAQCLIQHKQRVSVTCLKPTLGLTLYIDSCLHSPLRQDFRTDTVHQLIAQFGYRGTATAGVWRRPLHRSVRAKHVTEVNDITCNYDRLIYCCRSAAWKTDTLQQRPLQCCVTR